MSNALSDPNFENTTLAELLAGLREGVRLAERLKELQEFVPDEDQAKAWSDAASDLGTIRDNQEWIPEESEVKELSDYVSDLRERQQREG